MKNAPLGLRRLQLLAWVMLTAVIAIGFWRLEQIAARTFSEKDVCAIIGEAQEFIEKHPEEFGGDAADDLHRAIDNVRTRLKLDCD